MSHLADCRSRCRALTLENARLRAALAVQDGDVIIAPPTWAECLSPCEAKLAVALRQAYPAALSVYRLEEDTRPDHAKERDANVIQVQIHNIRKKLGRDTIQSAPGQGYRFTASGIEKTGGSARRP